MENNIKLNTEGRIKRFARNARIRQLASEGMTEEALAARYHMSKMRIQQIIKETPYADTPKTNRSQTV